MFITLFIVNIFNYILHDLLFLFIIDLQICFFLWFSCFLTNSAKRKETGNFSLKSSGVLILVTTIKLPNRNQVFPWRILVFFYLCINLKLKLLICVRSESNLSFPKSVIGRRRRRRRSSPHK